MCFYGFLLTGLYRRLLDNRGTIRIPLYRDMTEAGAVSPEPPASNDEFSAFLFWFDLLGHRLVEALPVHHRLSYRDTLCLKVALESHELAYA